MSNTNPVLITVVLFTSICGALSFVCYAWFRVENDIKKNYTSNQEQNIALVEAICKSQKQHDDMTTLFEDMCDKYKNLLEVNNTLRNKIDFYKDELVIIQTQMIKCAEENKKMRYLIFEDAEAS